MGDAVTEVLAAIGAGVVAGTVVRYAADPTFRRKVHWRTNDAIQLAAAVADHYLGAPEEFP